jgi:hypothetical protein
VKFYPRFDAIVLLSAPTDILLDRVASSGDSSCTTSERSLADILESIVGVSGGRDR